MECRQAAAQTWPRCAHLSACWRAGALRAVCVGPLLAWLPAEPRQELAQREELFINIYWSSQENLTNRTAVAASQRQSNKGHCAFLKHMRCQMDTHMATNVYTCVFLHAHIHITGTQTAFSSWTESRLNVQLSIFVSLAADFLITHPAFVAQPCLPNPLMYLSYYIIELLLKPNWKHNCCLCPVCAAASTIHHIQQERTLS